jgi:Fe-S-cluster containining protein
MAPVTRKLPMLLDRSLGELQAERLASTLPFEEKLRLTKHVSCKKGCANCCSHPLYISILEAIPIHRHLAEHGQWTPSFRRQLEAHAKKTVGLAIPVWVMLNAPCPLLTSEKMCSAYDARPANCRLTFSTGDPDYCHPHALRDGLTEIVNRVPELKVFHEKEKALLRRHGLMHLTMPISQALLVADEILSGSLDLEDADHEFAKRYDEARG